MDSTPDTRTTTVFGLAPTVSLTRLPFGGSVLVHGISLALLECSEREAHAIDQLLELDVDGWRMAPAGQRRMVQELTAAGWLAHRTADAEHTQRRTGGRDGGPATARTAAKEG
jgi:hypothetical protein